VSEARSENDRQRGALLRGRGERGRNGGRWYRDDGEIGGDRQRLIGLYRGNAPYRMVARINEMDGAGKTAPAEIPQYRMPDG